MSRRGGAARRPQLSVAGGGVCTRRTTALAHAVGRAIAASGAVLVCGGLGGVMGAAARGAARAGGTVVGLLPGYDASAGSRDLTIAIPTGLGHARNVLVAAAGDALIALPGEHGTLAEIALARAIGRPVVVLGGWRGLRGVRRASTPEEAVRRALALAAAQRPGMRGRGAGRAGPGLR